VRTAKWVTGLIIRVAAASDTANQRLGNLSFGTVPHQTIVVVNTGVTRYDTISPTNRRDSARNGDKLKKGDHTADNNVGRCYEVSVSLQREECKIHHKYYREQHCQKKGEKTNTIALSPPGLPFSYLA
jgi:hypothetical protein